MREQVLARAQKAIKDAVFPGCVVAVSVRGERNIIPCGALTYRSAAPSVAENTVYDLASITKAIPTASLALNFLEKGAFELVDSVKKYIPELNNDFGATIEDLLRYRVEGPRMSVLAHLSADGIRTHILEHGFAGAPGASVYTNLPAFLLGMVLERFAGDTLDDLAEGHFCMPLAMRDTGFFPPEKERCAPTEVVDGGEVRGTVHDESARVFARAGIAVGHAGLFSTAPDLLAFLESLMSGTYPNVLDGAERGLGFEKNAAWMGRAVSSRAFGKTGFTGTSFLCDPEKGKALVILSNRTYPIRPHDSGAIGAFRRDIADIVFG